MPLNRTQRRNRRVNRFRRRYSGPQPKLQVGDVVGGFNVIEYLGYSPIPPTGKPRALSQSHHWYRVRCQGLEGKAPYCGEEEVHSQQQLIDERRLRVCKKCAQPGEKSPTGDGLEN